MKIVAAAEMARIEKLAYADGASEEQFMESAGMGIALTARRLIASYHLKPRVILLCGSGNNGGDAYVAGRILRTGGCAVTAIALAPFDKSSPLCQLQSRRFIDEGGRVNYVTSAEDLHFDDGELIIDGILGTGFHGTVSGLFKAAIEKANLSQLPILSVDIPSGIDGTTGKVGGIAIQASHTLFLGLPKSGCFSQEAWDHVGQISTFNFGLDEKYLELAETKYQLIEDSFVRGLFPKMRRTQHKYQAGYVVGVGGSKGMPGAPTMSAFAALNAGTGIVRLLIPEGMEGEFGSAPLELIRQGYRYPDEIEAVLEKAHAIFIGPGMGTAPAAVKTLQSVLPRLNRPTVIDADALTILSEHDIHLPSETILTPHHGEMKRLLHAEKEMPFEELLTRSQAYADKKNSIIILKGAPTYILQPHGTPYVCSRGDPGMATAGSGDVLTGIVAGFLAQTHHLLHAAILAVQIHSVAGEYAAAKRTSFCMTATDIIRALPDAFRDYIAGGTRLRNG